MQTFFSVSALPYHNSCMGEQYINTAIKRNTVVKHDTVLKSLDLIFFVSVRVLLLFYFYVQQQAPQH